METLRDFRRSYRQFFNCGGYALNTFNWYVPTGFTVGETVENVQGILKDFDGRIRLISSEAEAQPHERIVFYRETTKSIIDDFHFIYKAKNNCYYHKCGRTITTERMKKQNVYSDYWANELGEGLTIKYDSELYIFALNMSENN